MDPRVQQIMRETGLDQATAQEIVAQMDASGGQTPGAPQQGGSSPWADAAAKYLGPGSGIANAAGGLANAGMHMWQGTPGGQLATGAMSGLSGLMQPAPEAGPQVQAPDPTPAFSAIQSAGSPVPPPQGAPSAAGGSGMPQPGEGGDPRANTPPPAAPGSPSEPATNGANQTPTPPATTSGGTPSQSDPSTSSGGYSSSPALREENRFGLRPSDQSPFDWGGRVFKEGLADSGSNLYNPTVGNSPWGQFLQQRYAPELGGQMAAGMLSGKVQAGGESGFAHDSLRNSAVGGGSPAGGDSNIFAGLRDAANAISSYSNGGHFDNPLQVSQLAGVADDPGAQANLLGQSMRGVGGGWGQRGLQNIISSMYSKYQNDPAQNAPGSFASSVLKSIGAM